MSKNVNVVNTAQLASAKFEKIFGNDESMYIEATIKEMQNYINKNPKDFYLFVVPREKPLISERFLPRELLKNSTYDFIAQPGEFYVFQVVVWTPESALFNVDVSSANAVNLMKAGNVRGGELKIFWLGIDVPKNIGGNIVEEVIVSTENYGNKSVKFEIKIEGDFLSDKGDSDDEKMSRLRWLNSDIGVEDTVFDPYIPLKREETVISWLGHTLLIGENGLPVQITTEFFGKSKQLLNSPVKIEFEGGEFLGRLEFVKETQTRIEWKSKGRIGQYEAKLCAAIEFDGFLEFSFITEATGNFALCIDCMNSDYLVGLGRHGGKSPKRMDWFWDKHAWQDGCWLGNTEGGIRLRLRDSKYNQPLTNCYYHFSELNLPEAWYNGGRGGISLQDNKLTAFSGKIDEIKKLEFGFDLQITPFHLYDVEKHLKTRAWHPFMHEFEIGGSDPFEVIDFAKLKAEGVNRINIHHAIGQNPFINYPFSNISIGKLKALVEKAHKYEMEVLLYYTMRELSIHPAEFWALRAMGDEIFQDGLGQDARPATNYNGPNAWLCENMFTPYIAAWGETIKNGPACNNIDLSLETTPESKRLENFFLEGLRYLLERCPIDGLYLDDISISRQGFQRVYRIFNKYRGKNPVVDFHAWTTFDLNKKSRDFGRSSVILRDMINLPYYTELWLGEGYDYNNSSSDFYLTEISGIPFGLMGQMLHEGGNPWRGILYGMTSRYGWCGDPRSLWQFFDEFGLSSVKMELDAEFPTELPLGIHVTRFTNDFGNTCYALASWCNEPVKIELGNIGYQTKEILGFQSAGQCVIEPGKGLILTKL